MTSDLEPQQRRGIHMDVSLTTLLPALGAFLVALAALAAFMRLLAILTGPHDAAQLLYMFPSGGGSYTALTVGSVLLLAVSVLLVTAGWQLLRLRTWARWALVGAFTLLGVYMLVAGTQSSSSSLVQQGFNPLAMVGLGFAVGMIILLLIPSTSRDFRRVG